VLQSWHSGSHCRHHTLRKMGPGGLICIMQGLTLLAQ
jgi:hypothetical protein